MNTRNQGLATRETELTYRGIELTIRYDYDAAEPGDNDHPGIPANVDVLEVLVRGHDITELFDWHAMDDLADRVLESIE